MEIFLERIGHTVLVSQRDIGVGPQQVECVARKAGSLVVGSPGKDVHGYALLFAPCSETGAGGAIDMDLPTDCGERGEIIGAVGLNPGQPIAALHASGGAAAQ